MVESVRIHSLYNGLKSCKQAIGTAEFLPSLLSWLFRTQRLDIIGGYWTDSVQFRTGRHDRC